MYNKKAAFKAYNTVYKNKGDRPLMKIRKKSASIPNRIIVAGLLVLFQIGFFVLVERTMSSGVAMLYRAVEILALILIFMIISCSSVNDFPFIYFQF